MNILFIFGTGSEIRQFLFSGVIDDLNSKGHQVFVSSKADIKDELGQRVKYCNFVPFYKVQIESGILSRISRILDIAFEKKFQIRHWKYNPQKSGNEKGFVKSISALVALPPVWWFLSRAELFLQPFLYRKDWSALLISNKIDRIIVSVSRNYPGVLYSAKKNKTPVLLLYHTNKDIFAQGRVNFKFTKIGVWNEGMKQDLLLFNNNIKSSRIKTIGCTHFSYINNSNLVLQPHEMLNRYGINTGEKKIILYTTTGPGIVTNEMSYINDIRKSLHNLNVVDYLIVVRTNPMDFTNEWEIENKESDLLIIRPKWYYNPAEAFNFTYEEDLSEFVSLLYYSSVCINIPSTVTIEAALLKKPVLNICYMGDGVLCSYPDIKDFWNAGFNREVRETKAAEPVFSFNELGFHLAKILSGHADYDPAQNEFLKKVIDYNSDSFTKRAVDFILDEAPETSNTMQKTQN